MTDFKAWVTQHSKITKRLAEILLELEDVLDPNDFMEAADEIREMETSELYRKQVGFHAYGTNLTDMFMWKRTGAGEKFWMKVEFEYIRMLRKNEKESTMRNFSTGATRDTADNKPDYEGYLSPLVLERFGQYMLKHQKQADGNLRASDNWQKGIPLNVYISSAFRHFFDVWKEHRGIPSPDGLEDSLCALMFNIMGYFHETLKGKTNEK